MEIHDGQPNPEKTKWSLDAGTRVAHREGMPGPGSVKTINENFCFLQV
jgi:hypothetical protein